MYAKECQFSCSRPPQWITRNAFRISLQPDWQIDNIVFNRPIIARTQMLVHSMRPRTGISALFGSFVSSVAQGSSGKAFEFVTFFGKICLIACPSQQHYEHPNSGITILLLYIFLEYWDYSRLSINKLNWRSLLIDWRKHSQAQCNKREIIDCIRIQVFWQTLNKIKLKRHLFKKCLVVYNHGHVHVMIDLYVYLVEDLSNTEYP